jgi:hypothetical protein
MRLDDTNKMKKLVNTQLSELKRVYGPIIQTHLSEHFEIDEDLVIRKGGLDQLFKAYAPAMFRHPDFLLFD